MYWGSGSAEGAPKPPFTFVAEAISGTKPKIDVTDAAGTTWRAKFAGTSSTGNEVHAEIAATRLMWALGYPVEEQNYVPEGRIEDVKALTRAAGEIGADGSFRV